jgi:two-component system, OmpR family, response regulator
MNKHNEILIIDSTPIEQDLIDYCTHHNFSIKQKLNPDANPQKHETLAAILIHRLLLSPPTTLLTELFDTFKCPIIVIDDEYNEEACVSSLGMGADDCLTKPLNPRELLARINAAQRRINSTSQKESAGKEVIKFTLWTLYPRSRKIFNAAHQELQLSTGEFELLLAFVRQPHKILDRDTLLQNTKNLTHAPLDRRIDVQISRLRQKIEVDAKQPAIIKTIRNQGYMFMAEVVCSLEV